MKVKDFKPTYQMIEAIPCGSLGWPAGPPKLMHISEFVKQYGDLEVYSVMDYHDTKSTSVCFGWIPADDWCCGSAQRKDE